MHTNQYKNWIAVFIGFAMLFMQFASPISASACQPNKPCADAPGQVAPVVVTVDAKDVNVVPGTTINNGGQVVNGNGHGVVQQALDGTNNSTVTISVSSLDEAPALPANTNATIIVIPPANSTVTQVTTGSTVTTSTSGTSNGNGTVDLSYLAGTPGYDENGTPTYTYEQFLAALTYDCPDQICENAALKNPKGWWMHYPVSNLYQETGNHLTSMCRETSNSNNLLEDDHGGWANISWHLYQDYLNKTKVFGDPVEC